MYRHLCELKVQEGLHQILEEITKALRFDFLHVFLGSYGNIYSMLTDTEVMFKLFCIQDNSYQTFILLFYKWKGIPEEPQLWLWKKNAEKFTKNNS